MRRNSLVALALATVVATLPGHARGAEEAADPIVERTADVRSEGVRLTANLYSLASRQGKPLPTIIMSHGWGGTAASLQPQARAFAAAGYFVVAFDYRGWGESDPRVILTGPAPGSARPSGSRFTAEVLEVREVIDPLEQAEDIFNVIHWAVGEPMVDRHRIGLWGTSFSGGLVVYVAARDPRVKAVVSQVPFMGQPIERFPPPALARAHESGTARARAERGYPPPGAREVGNLPGAPIREKFLRYAPVDDMAGAKGCAMLFIAAEREELFSNQEHPALAYQRAAEPKRYVVIPGIGHYGVYGEAREQATRLAIDWFDQQLKP